MRLVLKGIKASNLCDIYAVLAYIAKVSKDDDVDGNNHVEHNECNLYVTNIMI